jgi:hypothetical protein
MPYRCGRPPLCRWGRPTGRDLVTGDEAYRVLLRGTPACADVRSVNSTRPPASARQSARSGSTFDRDRRLAMSCHSVTVPKECSFPANVSYYTIDLLLITVSVSGDDRGVRE